MPTTSITKKEAEISLRAYEIWEAEGKPHGKDFDHWLKAEAELVSTAKAARPARKNPAAKKTTAKKTTTKKAAPAKAKK
jgi:hypothetical protein